MLGIKKAVKLLYFYLFNIKVINVMVKGGYYNYGGGGGYNDVFCYSRIRVINNLSDYLFYQLAGYVYLGYIRF